MLIGVRGQSQEKAEMSEGAEQNELSKYTWEEVAKHRTSESLWIVIHDKVYDVTKFMEEVGYCILEIILRSQLFQLQGVLLLTASRWRGGTAGTSRCEGVVIQSTFVTSLVTKPREKRWSGNFAVSNYSATSIAAALNSIRHVRKNK